jgi:hypothetical protein
LARPLRGWSFDGAPAHDWFHGWLYSVDNDEKEDADGAANDDTAGQDE